MRLQTLIPILWLFISQQVFGTPRTVVEQIATTIEANYFDVHRGIEIGAGLREAATAGHFDSLTDPRDLASVLSSRLQSFDHHFLVTWSAQSASAKGLSVVQRRYLQCISLSRSQRK